VAQPIYEVLRQNGDFFVAHRASPLDLALFVTVLTVVLPALLALAIRAVGLVSARLAGIAHVGVIGLLAAALASQVIVRAPLGAAPHVVLAIAAGAAGAWGYARSAGVRWSFSVMALSAPVFAAMFLFHPSMAPFVRPVDRTRTVASAVPAGAPPIVMVVFDQLPLASLLRPDGAMDAARYPGFAELSAGSTWYRGASANGELTGWALPAIMSGALPRPERFPISQHHPQNLFTVLGGGYRFEVVEPITKLCPERLCVDQSVPRAQRVAAMTLDSAVVYAHVVAPRDLRASLPALTDDWKDFAQTDTWQWRWVQARDNDRREPVARFLESIDDGDPQPTLYFLHALLPHEPYVYLRSGQQFTPDTRLPGLTGERWNSDEWLATQGYQRHLAQASFVDTIVGRLLAKLRAEGLYDRALLVVTADHGVSFRPGLPWKGLDRATLPDIMAVPLFIKAPGQRAGRVDMRNMQAIDILPTLAAMLGVPLRRPVDGAAATAAASPGTLKTIRYGGATQQTTVEAAELERLLMAAVARRWSLFPEGRAPAPPGAPRHLLGRAWPASPSSSATLQVLLEQPQRFRDVDLSAPVLPLHLFGRVLDADGRPAAATLAVGINGTIRALTRSLVGAPGSRAGSWAAFLEPDALRSGRNLVQVFVVAPGGDLQLAYSSGGRPEGLNLASNAAADFWSVGLDGLYAREGTPVPHRWTTGEARLIVPLDVDPRPRSLRVGLTGPPTSGGPVQIRINECTMHDGPIDSAPWYRTFALDACPAVRGSTEARIVIRSGTSKETNGRIRGVAIETVNLFAAAWPPSAPGPGDWQGRATLDGPVDAVARAAPIGVWVRNTGRSPWVQAGGDGETERSGVALELRWRSLPAGPADRSQRLRIPRVAFPGDRVHLEVPVVPPPGVDGAGPWEVGLALVTLDGVEIGVEESPVVRVAVAADTK